ncbi:polysaccharide deacetylase family protein [Methylomicrobium sp. Wu6]|uniref:polysaccharide deacetylase family protein n=1 Tax=Methylomicrobium sp. Wu6 TaxID=3107928 RepID=UPI002DD6A8C2|nr:polysaccharide deacetylase family protein [Methylomicrobium sp. Wu6]MEC4749576.1 polysaccharide deacetylase family protein [Methylomicrobium sp. Wu6]
MNISQFHVRVFGRYQRVLADITYRRVVKMNNRIPFISFTFDDFPRSALYTGGDILFRYGLRGTYYASLGLMNTDGPTGNIFVPDDIEKLLAQGHELGCHTFAHCHSWDTKPKTFESSILKNKLILSTLVPDADLSSFSYPISVPRPSIKRIAGKYFNSCRCGGQTYNAKAVDLNYLKAFFLEKSRDDIQTIKKLIDETCLNNGWLIFATHDISKKPTPYGCLPQFFEEVVRYSQDSNARILPVGKALEEILLKTNT